MKQRRVLLFGVLALALAVSACGGGGSSPTVPKAGVSQVEFGSFTLVNDERDTNAISPLLGNDEELSAIARDYSRQMRDQGFFSHISPAGETLRMRLSKSGYAFSLAGENLARVSNAGDPAGFAHELLMNNPNHRGNILNGSYWRLGVGVAVKGGTVWITQIYVRP